MNEVKCELARTALTCERCGFEYILNNREIWRRPNDYKLCKSCRAKPVRSVAYGDDWCEPWHGDYNDDDRPIKDGELYKPSYRICGHRDCVRTAHIMPAA